MRLTKKSGYHYYSYSIKEKENKNGSKRQYGKSITKLGQLEDVEAKLGIDLITLFKAFNGIFYKGKDNEIKFACHLLLTDNWSFIVLDDWLTYQKTNFYPSLGLKDYGKTWALTKEELK